MRSLSVLLIVALCAPLVAFADKPVTGRCTLVEIAASADKKGIDPKLERFRAVLTRPPFSAYSSFTWLGSPTVSLKKDQAATARLATGGALTLVFRDVFSAQGRRDRLRIEIQMDSKSGKRTLTQTMSIDAGDTHFLAGVPLEGGRDYVLGLTCTSP